MTRELLIGIIGVIFVLALAGYFFLQYQSLTAGFLSPSPSPNGQSPTGTPSPAANLVLTLAEVVKHNTIDDCWIIFQNKVYLLPAFHLQGHPGGAAAILPFCGKDATAAFLTKGGQGSHSSSASAMLANFYLGDLNTRINSQVVQNIQKQPPVFNNKNESEREND